MDELDPIYNYDGYITSLRNKFYETE